MKKYFYSLLARYFSFFIPRDSNIIILEPTSDSLRVAMRSLRGDEITIRQEDSLEKLSDSNADFIILSGNLHNEPDIQTYLIKLKSFCKPSTRVIISYYSSLWKPVFQFAEKLGIRIPKKGASKEDENWISPSDVENLLRLADFELVSSSQKVLIPIYIPILSNFINRWLPSQPIFRIFPMCNIALARPLFKDCRIKNKPSVSVVVAARNEAGNIKSLFERTPLMGPFTELIIIEGNSSDNTWQTIEELKGNYTSKYIVKTGQQSGKGKGDAVRKGFSMATGDILMILDADITVPPEDLTKFYNAIVEDKGEFINGSRLVYPMEGQAMRFFNIIGNKFFAAAFSYVLGQSFKDTLCGTKVMWRKDYEKVVANRDFFGDFDPFGDFDLLFGAARMSLKIVELPIRYKDRTYGETNISRWRDGTLLLRMVIFAARRIKFI